MQPYELSQIGEFHTNHNEDSYTITEIGTHQFLIAVMDGCSMGKESHFASTLIAKLLRKIGKEISYKAFIEPASAFLPRSFKKTSSEYLKEIFERLFHDLKQIKNQLLLEREEVLSTLVLGVLDVAKKEVELITIGDGLICCNQKLYEYEQDDQPDYLAYHLSEEFEDWFSNQSQRLSLKQVSDLSLSTDGIFTFKNFDGKGYDEMTEKEIIEFLLVDKSWNHQEHMLYKKVATIENDFGLKPSDDLTIIRFIMG